MFGRNTAHHFCWCFFGWLLLTRLVGFQTGASLERLIERLFRREDWTHATEASQGWQAIKDELRLSGWSKARRMVVLRRRIKHGRALTAKKKRRAKDEAGHQLVLALPVDEVQGSAQAWEYTVLVTNAPTPYDITAIGQLYRDGCDCENGFDELKNHWGWGGFTTQDMHCSQVSARAVAMVYNGWSGRVRAANPQARREALTSRPLLLSASWVAAAFLATANTATDSGPDGGRTTQSRLRGRLCERASASWWV